jgi:hypothetical protein
MEDAMFVTILEGITDLDRDAKSFSRRKRSWSGIFEDSPQRLALNIFDYEVFLGVLFAGIDEMLDVRMVDAVANFGFAFVALEDRDVANEILAGEFEDNVLL